MTGRNSEWEDTLAPRSAPPTDRPVLHDLRFRLTDTGSGTYRVAVTSDLGDEAEGAFAIPFTPSELERLSALVDPRLAKSLDLDAARRLGGDLLSALTRDRGVLAVFGTTQRRARELGHGVRITLILDAAPQLGRLPWELLYSRPGFLALSAWSPVVRFVEREVTGKPPSIELPLNILGMVSSPRAEEYGPIDSVEERELLEAALARLTAAGMVKVRWLPDGTLASLRAEVAYGGPIHVFHYIGHGEYDERTSTGMLVLEDAQQRPHCVTGELVGALLCDRRTLQLAVLNACEGARASASDSLSGVAGGLVEHGVPAVVAMQSAISDDAAVAFAHELYQLITNEQPIDLAVTECRRALAAEDTLEWAVPVLVMSTPNVQLFKLPHLSEVTIKLDRPRFSVTALRRADRAGDAQAAFDLGLVLGEQKRWREAEAAYRRADARGHARAALVLGVILANRGDETGAITAYSRAAERGEPDAAFNLGNLYRNRGNDHAAVAAYRRAVELGSTEAPANLGSLLERLGRRADAEHAYRIGLERNDPTAVNSLGLLFAAHGSADALEDARRCFERAMSLGSAEGAANLGALLFQAGDSDGAERAYRTADERGNAPAAYNLGTLLLQRGDTAGAYAAVRRAAQRGHLAAQALLEA